jgi:hypothetical protein
MSYMPTYNEKSSGSLCTSKPTHLRHQRLQARADAVTVWAESTALHALPDCQHQAVFSRPCGQRQEHGVRSAGHVTPISGGVLQDIHRLSEVAGIGQRFYY